jgi:hypothetical protein
VIAVMLAFCLAMAPILQGIAFLGDARQALPTVALDHIGHVPGSLHTSLGAAVAVLAAWVAAAFTAGAWRTRSREI